MTQQTHSLRIDANSNAHYHTILPENGVWNANTAGELELDIPYSRLVVSGTPRLTIQKVAISIFGPQIANCGAIVLVAENSTDDSLLWCPLLTCVDGQFSIERAFPGGVYIDSTEQFCVISKHAAYSGNYSWLYETTQSRTCHIDLWYKIG